MRVEEADQPGDEDKSTQKPKRVNGKKKQRVQKESGEQRRAKVQENVNARRLEHNCEVKRRDTENVAWLMPERNWTWDESVAMKEIIEKPDTDSKKKEDKLKVFLNALAKKDELKKRESKYAEYGCSRPAVPLCSHEQSLNMGPQSSSVVIVPPETWTVSPENQNR
jgi:hypothetical protein